MHFNNNFFYNDPADPAGGPYNFGMVAPVTPSVGMMVCQNAAAVLSVTAIAYDVCTIKLKELFEEKVLKNPDDEKSKM
jgi:hypothetical protein